MKRVKALCGIQGNGWAIDEGEIQDWGDDRYELFVKAGYVELVEDLSPKPKRKAASRKKATAKKK